jgi:TatD DNase family protein
MDIEISIPYINIHTHSISTGNVLVILNVYPSDTLPDHVYLSSGIHPWYTDDWEKQMQQLTKLIKDNRIAAIGECGLDIQSLTSIEIQKKIFCKQVELSETFNKPLIIHCVKAFNELIQIHKKLKPAMPWILHGFNPNMEIANRCLELQMKLSFGKLLLLGNIKLENIVQNIPVASVFLETDESEIAITDIYDRYAAIKELPLESLKTEMMNNFKVCFNRLEVIH